MQNVTYVQDQITNLAAQGYSMHEIEDRLLSLYPGCISHYRVFLLAWRKGHDRFVFNKEAAKSKATGEKHA